MTIFQGHWAEMPENPNYSTPEPTHYLRANREVNEDIRETLSSWCDDLETVAERLAENIRLDEPELSKSQCQREAWAVLDQGLHGYTTPEPIANDPQVYATQKVIKVCRTELVAKQKNGRLKDVKKSLVDRHNWQVVRYAYLKFGTESETDLTQDHLDWIEARVIDVQSNPVATITKSQRLLNGVFE